MDTAYEQTTTKKKPKTTNGKAKAKNVKPLTSVKPAADFVSKMTKSNQLNSLLATEYMLFTKTLNYHWNIEGPRFHSLQGFLEDQYKELLQIIDSVAERNRKLGTNAIGTLKKFTEFSRITEKRQDYPMTNAMIDNLVRDHKLVIAQISQMIRSDAFAEDIGSQDFLTETLRKHEEMVWMLSSHL